jgi:hypothetical protein
MPLQATSGAASYDAFGGGVAAVPQYIEDVFNTYLYTGNSSTQTIINGIDLSTKGGFVWTKTRSSANSHNLFDSTRALNQTLSSNTTQAQQTINNGNPLTFNTNGFSLPNSNDVNVSGTTYASWTFRKQPKFFDVVTWTGNAVQGRQIAHSLGSTPGCIFVKCTSTTSNWTVYHRSLTTNYILQLNSTTNAINVGSPNAYVSAPTDTTFTVGNDSDVNASGATYVAYLFAHNAGGFGLTGTDNVISCGSFTQSIGGFVNLGFEPQWVLTKRTSGVDDWRLFDNMRGMTMGDDSLLNPNLSAAENNSAGNDYLNPQPTGFTTIGFDSGTHIYIAIRRGPMKVPTSGTSVFGLNARNGNDSYTTVTGGAGVTDFSIIKNRGAATNWVFASRLTANRYLSSNLTAAEVSASTAIFQPNPWDVMDGVKVGTGSSLTNQTENTYINYLFDRAPSFMDVVCYTGTGSATTFAHNLGVVPEMMIVKRRNTTGEWRVYVSSIGANDSLKLQTNEIPQGGSAFWDSTTPTASVFTVGTSADTNASGSTYINRLFATCAGVSKVGSYTGNDTTQTINCGFTTGARFVLVKRTDNTANWATSDTARGMVSGTNPALRVNLTNAESAADFFVTTSVGFQIVSSDPTVNADGGTYIFLAIA